MQYRCFIVRMNNRPSATAGVALHSSSKLLVATSSNFSGFGL